MAGPSSLDLPNFALKIQTEWQTYEKVLRPGDEIWLGRDPAADIPIPRASVSGKHLRVHWSGFEIFVADIGSDNGTFLQKDKSPFVEARSREKNFHLELLISKSPVSLEGRILAPPTPQKNKSADAPLKPKPVSIEPRRFSKNEAEDLARWFAASFLSLALSFCLVAFSTFLIFPILELGPEVLLKGAALDIHLLWAGFLVSKPFFYALTLAVFLLLLFLQVTGRFSIARRLETRITSYFVGKVFFQAGLLKFLPLVVLILAILWMPLLGSFVSGFRYQPIASEYFKFWRVSKSKTLNLDTRSQELKALSEDLLGSSLLYKEILVTDNARILSNCGGVGTAEWEAKKVCLFLLAANAIENLDRVKPAAVAKPAARIALLTAMDGLVRTVGSEGPSSSSVDFFVSALIDIGLGPEADQILTLIRQKNFSKSEVINELNSLRRSTENALNKDFADLSLPEVFRVNVSSPLEYGI